MANERMLSLRQGAGAAVILTALLACAATSPAAAQNCFRGQPLPTCETFWLTEVGFSLGTTERPLEGSRGTSRGPLLAWELGGMKNLTRVMAVGASAFVEGNGVRMAGWLVGAKAHYRRWLGPHTSLDVAPGVFLAGEEPYQPRLSQMRGTLLAVSYNSGDLVSITVQVEGLQDSDGNLNPSLYAGVRLGSYAGALAAVAAALVSFSSLF